MANLFRSLDYSGKQQGSIKFDKVLPEKILNKYGEDVTPRDLSAWSSFSSKKDFDMFLDSLKSNSVASKRKISSERASRLMSVGDIYQIIYSIWTNNTRGNFKLSEEFEIEKVPELSGDSISEIILQSTETFTMFESPDKITSKDYEDGEYFIKRMKDYHQLIKVKLSSEKYVSKCYNTCHEFMKNKYAQTNPIKHRIKQTQVSNRNFYDSNDDEDHSNKFALESMCSNDPSINTINYTDLLIYKNSNFRKSLILIDRILSYNIYYPCIAVYRNVPILEDVSLEPKETTEIKVKSLFEDEFSNHLQLLPQKVNGNKVEPNKIKLLWCFNCLITNDLSVSSISWNKSNMDILAAGYCHFDFKRTTPGIFACWSIKNIENPERVYRTEYGVTSCSFSYHHPFLLAVGFQNGDLSFYNLSIESNKSVYSSIESSLGHTSPVWDLKWTIKNGHEVLMSVSTDGRVLQWSFINGLECRETSTLKLKLLNKETSEETFKLGNKDGGLCFDFNFGQPEIYLVGTESGLIHKCSTIHANQYMRTYIGHIAPVYKVKWSFFDSSIFASCSADMTVKIWHQDYTSPICDFITSSYACCPVNDIAWSPEISTLIVCAFDCHIQIWDFHINRFDPILILPCDEKINKKTCIKFALHNKSCVLVGDNIGNICVYKLDNLKEEELAVDTQKVKLANLIDNCVLKYNLEKSV